MKSGVNNNSFLKKIVIATIYFVLFTTFTFIGGEYVQEYTQNGGNLRLIMFFICSTIVIGFLILFISMWESIFESEDEQ